MTNVEELKMAVASLPGQEYSQFRQWFFDRDWDLWDRKIESDSGSGKLDFLIQEAADAKNSHQLKNL